MCSYLLFLWSQIRPRYSQWQAEFDGKVYDLDPTLDGEACGEPHGAANKAKLGLQGHLHILLYLVVGGRVEIYLDQLQGGGLGGGGWAE